MAAGALHALDHHVDRLADDHTTLRGLRAPFRVARRVIASRRASRQLDPDPLRLPRYRAPVVTSQRHTALDPRAFGVLSEAARVRDQADVDGPPCSSASA
jgi:hypothetical protein